MAAAKKEAAQAAAPPTPQQLQIVYRPLAWFLPYGKNPRKNDKVVGRMADSIKEFGFAVPCLAKSDGELIDGHLRLKAAVLMKMPEVPVILCDNWSDAQVKAFRLLVNRSVAWAEWDLGALALEFGELKALEFDLSLTGFDMKEIDSFLLPAATPEEDEVPPVPDAPVSRTGDLWVMGSTVKCPHCGTVNE